jgi:hypothetical protein
MKKTAKAGGEMAAKAMLDEHAYPLQFHQAGALFLVQVTTPQMSTSPLVAIKRLWGGDLPVFDSIDDLNALLGALVQGLWNELTRHQKRSQPFRLTRTPMEETNANLALYGRTRLEELDGFLDGLFLGADSIDLQERAHEAVNMLAQLRITLAGICDALARHTYVDDRPELDMAFTLLRDLPRIMETEIHEAALPCTRARRQMLETILTKRPTVH